MLVIVFAAFMMFFYNDGGIDVGTISFFKVAGVDITFFVLCCYLGSICGLIISFLSEYFTSQSCPPAREVAASCNKGLPLNILRATTYGNLVTTLFILIEASLIMIGLRYGGGLGLSYAGILLTGYLLISGVFVASGGIASSAKRVSRMIDIRPKDP